METLETSKALIPSTHSNLLSVIIYHPKTLPLLMLLLIAGYAHATKPIVEMPLWQNGLPGGRTITLEEEWKERPIEEGADVDLDRSVKNISNPTLTVYRPDKPNAHRTAIVIIPGGGFSHLAIDKEGHDVARWLNSHGITGIVVKYRVVHEDSDFHVYNACVPDSLRAIRLARYHARDWDIDPEMLGVMGFSAGGYLTAAAGTLYDEGDPKATDPIERMSCKPNFIAPIYPLIDIEDRLANYPDYRTRLFGSNTTPDLPRQFAPLRHINSSTPPTFLVHAHDDNLSARNSLVFYLALLEANVSAELHVYSEGGHGYGIRQRGLPLSNWHERFLDWMKIQNFHQ